MFDKITREIAERTPAEEKTLWDKIGYYPEEN